MYPISFVEIGAPCAATEAAFFTQLFGWPWRSMGDNGEGYFEPEDIQIGVHGNDASTGIVPYFRVDDIENATKQVVRLGGTAELPASSEPSFGHFVNCISAQGLRFGLHQPIK